MPEPTLDWSTAEVKDSTLTVQVDGEVPDGWADTFNTTVKLLGGGSWGEIKLEEQKAEVNGLTPGTEEKLKHFLESVVQQANATHSSDGDEQEGEEEGEDRKDDEDSEEDKESDSDKEMAEQFRSFAEGDDDSEDGDGDENRRQNERDSEDDDADEKGRSKKERDSKNNDEDSDDESSE